MILSDKTQCRSCIEYGRVKKFPGWCCIGIDEQGRVHCERAARRSNCWCLDFKPNGRPFHMQNFHMIGKYLTERYGPNVKLIPITWDSITKATDFRVEIESRKLRFPIAVVFSLTGGKDTYSYEDLVQILMNYEVKDR